MGSPELSIGSRIECVAQSREFQRPAKFDVVDHLAWSIAALPRKFVIEIRLETNLDRPARTVFKRSVFWKPDGSGVLLRSQADDLEWFARELASVAMAVEDSPACRVGRRGEVACSIPAPSRSD